MASIIQSFSVYGLFGTQDVHIPFDEPVKILVGENGIGKTQVMNLFYYMVTGNFFTFAGLNFNKLVLIFSDGQVVEVMKEDVQNTMKEFTNLSLLREAMVEVATNEVNWVIANYSNTKTKEELVELLLDAMAEKRNVNKALKLFIDKANEKFLEPNRSTLPNELSFLNKLHEYKTKIHLALKDLIILYFPAFRRIEEDLHKLGYEKEDTSLFSGLEQENAIFVIRKQIALLQFGMGDVQNRFDELQAAISELVKSEVNSYEKRQLYDQAIEAFKAVCNRYLVNKEVFYDKSAIKIFIRSTINGQEIALSNLSSGEKQIISIFSKIYLADEGQRFIVLFDEPELSLSMPWQKQLLPDIMNSKKCEFLMAVTHSPFIFDNELDQYAVGLSEYIELHKPITV